jgi:hypothetical protein
LEDDMSREKTAMNGEKGSGGGWQAGRVFAVCYLLFVLVLVSGCFNPVSFAEPEVKASGPDLPATGAQEEEFTVTLRVGSAPGARSVVGPGARTIQFGSIRNYAQVIVADSEGKIVDVKEARRQINDNAEGSLEITNILLGESYHFLVLMGYWPTASGPYDYDEGPGVVPTLLAAGFATVMVEAEKDITITMKPVVVDTVFGYGGAEAGAALGGATLLPRGLEATLAWRVMGGFDPLVSAQKAARGGGGGDKLLFGDGEITIIRDGVANESAVLSGIEHNEIAVGIDTDNEVSGSVNFNLKYTPFGSGGAEWGGFAAPRWIIRNGVNDEAQDEDTYFPNPVSSAGAYPWTGGKNGNGAVVYTVEERTVDLTNLVPAPVMGGTPVRSFAGPQYTGTVDWTKTSPGAAHTGLFGANTAYTARVTLTAGTGFTFVGLEDGNFKHGTLPGTDIAYDPDNPGVVIIEFPETGNVPVATVNDLNLTNYVPAPVTGGTPGVNFTATQYRSTAVTWTKANNDAFTGNFQSGTAYKAVVTLEAASGYIFTGVGANSFIHTGADGSPTNAANSGVVTITFPATSAGVTVKTVSDMSLTYWVPAPVTGETPGGAFTATQYTGAVAWTEADGSAIGAATFQSGTAYKAVVTLTAASGYIFTGVGANSFIHTGAAGSPANAVNTGVVTIIFPATTSVTVKTVSDMSLTYWVPAPVTGGTPGGAFTATQYTGAVAWTKADGSAIGAATFQPGTAYKAVVTLAAASGYIFTGVGENSFIHTGAEGSPANDANSGVVTITFPATTSVTVKTVSDLNLSFWVPAPVTGGTPGVNFTATQYRSTAVTWTKANGDTFTGNFQSGTAYKAVVTLEAASDYTFTGVGENSFIHTGAAGSPTNEKDGNVVTITFPATTVDATAVTVDDLNLAPYLAAPVAGATPQKAVEGAQYRGWVAWARTDNQDPVAGLFAAGTAYTAKVTLQAASGRKFDGLMDNSFTHGTLLQGTDIVYAPANPGVVTINFPATGSVPVVTVTDLDLTYKVPAPRPGETPVKSVAGQGYTGTVAWTYSGNTSHTGLFATNTAYKATVTLTAGAGFTFAGLTAANFTHDDAAVDGISYGPNPGVVSITFPATGNNSATGSFLFSSLPFSGAYSTDDDSAIDVIKGYKGQPALYLKLTWQTAKEDVELDGSTDLDTTGLVLDASNSPANITIDGSDRVIDLTGSATGSLITVGAGVTLTLKNITFKGLWGPNPNNFGNGPDSNNNTASLIRVEANGTLILENDAVIRDNVAVKPGQGGGVYVAGGGSLTMKTGSEISHNQAHVGGGVQVDGAFTMEGGTIKSNFAHCTGDGGFGGGVCVNRKDGNVGTMTMTGGVIYGDSDATFGNDVDNPNNNTGGDPIPPDGHAVFYRKDGGSIGYDSTIPNGTDTLPFIIP